MEKNIVYKTILKRRSIRQFINKKISNEQIDILLHAAMAAPSACNLQPWAFIVVDEEQQLEKLKKVTTQGDYNAPLAIVVCGINKHIPWEGDDWKQDCGGACQNIMLTCVEMNLASVCVGGFDYDALCKVLEIPSDVYPLCIIEIGYPAYEKEPLSWYDKDAVYYQKYDENRSRTLRTLEMLKDDIKNGKI